jgi:hypothetical protein
MMSLIWWRAPLNKNQKVLKINLQVFKIILLFEGNVLTVQVHVYECTFTYIQYTIYISMIVWFFSTEFFKKYPRFMSYISCKYINVDL